MSLTLYELTGHYRLLLDADEDGEFTTALAEIEGAIGDKAENIAKVIMSLATEADGFEKECERLDAHVRSRRNRIDHLKGYLKQSLEAAELQNIQGPLFKVSLQNSPPRCEIDDPSMAIMPPGVELRIIPARWEPDKRAILDWAKANPEEPLPPGIRIVQETHLRIR